MNRIWLVIIVAVLVVGAGYAFTRFTAPAPSSPILITSPKIPPIEPNMPTDATAGSVPVNSSASPAADTSDLAKMGSGQFSGWDTGVNMRDRVQKSLTAEYERQKAHSGQPSPTADSRILKPVGVQ
jgi:hypothetical protein